MLETSQVHTESVETSATLQVSLSPGGRFSSRKPSSQKRTARLRRCEVLGGHTSPRQQSRSQNFDNKNSAERSRSTPIACSQRARSIIKKLQRLVSAESSLCGCDPGTPCGELCQNRMMDYWCDEGNCSAGELCTNRCIDGGQDYYETCETANKGQGPRSTSFIPPNTFLGEYEGKYITREQALRLCRTAEYEVRRPCSPLR